MITQETLDRYSLAKSIILTSSDLRLHGCLIYKFDMRLVDTNQFTAFVFHNKSNNKLGIWISSDLINKLNNANEVAYVLVHEISHVLNRHLSRGKDLIHELFNIAGDHVINSALDEDIKTGKLKGLKSPESTRVVINSLLNQNLSAEEVYKYLLEHATYSSESYEFDPDAQPQSGQGQESEGDQESNNNQGSSQSANTNGSGKVTIKLNKIKIKLDDGQTFEIVQDMDMSGAEGQDQSQKDMQDDARRLLNSPIFAAEKKKGSGSGKLMEMIEEAIKVEIPWTELLENVIKTNITEMSDNKSWRRVNKRMYNYGMVLPYNDTEETFDTLLVIVDTSGSVSTDELKKFVHIIKSAMYHFKRVIKIDHDSRLEIENKKVYDNSTIDNLQGDTPIGFSGRGGTSHKEVYEYIEKLYEGDIDEQIPGLILLLTDFESDIHMYHHQCQWVKEIPYKYIISNTRPLNIPADIDPKPIFIT